MSVDFAAFGREICLFDPVLLVAIGVQQNRIK
jgi:hypothetical protein